MLHTLAAYLFAAMTAWSPISAHAYHETAPVTEARYLDFADQVASVVLDPAERPLFAGDDGRAKTALLLTAIASFESGGFDGTVIWCNRGGDGGRSWGPFQSQLSKRRACESVRSATRLALEQVRESFQVCRGYPQLEKLREYTDGNKYAEGYAGPRSITRFARATTYLSAHPFAAGID